MDESEARNWYRRGVDEKWPDDVFVEITSKYSHLRWDNVHHHRVRELIERYAPGQDVLDAGCSTGPMSQWAMECGATSVIGVDVGEDRLHKAHLRVPEGRFEHWDLQEPWPVDHESFGLIINVEVLEHLRRAGQAHLLHESARTLRRGGRLLITTPNVKRLAARTRNMEPEVQWTPHGHSHELSKGELVDLAHHAGLRIRVDYYRYPKVHSLLRLRGHHRVAALVESLPPRRLLAMGLLAVCEKPG